MSAFAPVTLAIGVATTEVLGPQSIDANGVAKWLGTAASLDAKKVLTMQVILPKAKGTVSRVKQRVTIPEIDPVTGLRTGESYVNVEAVFAKTASAATRTALRYAANDLSQEAVTIAAYDNLESIY